MTSALLIIDVQRILCTGEEAAFDIDRVMQNINAVSEKARAAGLPVVVIQHEDNGPMEYGTDEWQLADALVVQPTDLRVRKTTPDSFHKTELQDLLQARGIDRLLVCGLQSDFCVDTTVRRALALGYEVTLVADAHSTVDNGVLTAAQITAHHNRTLGSMMSFGRRVAITPAVQVQYA
jgi:nicotinamidase-related amidase